MWRVSFWELVEDVQSRVNRRLLPEPGSGPGFTRVGSTDLRGTFDVACVITTYNRPAALELLLGSLSEELRSAADAGRSCVLVFDDASTEDYRGAARSLKDHFEGRARFYRSGQNLGKRGYYRQYQRAFDELRSLGIQRALFLQDDLVLSSGFLQQSLSLWASIDDSRKAILNLFQTPVDEEDGRWIKFRRVDSGRGYRKTQWFDLNAYIAGPRFFDVLDYRVFPVPDARFRRDPTLSSGVGRQLVRRLWGRANIYQVSEPRVYHGKEPSLMNPEARLRDPLNNFPK